jgi:uncharacterized protein (UPF0297 family)
MSDTPRTEIVMLDPLRDGNDLPDLARTLERELNEANAERAQVWELLHEAYQPLRQSGNFELSERIRFLVDHGPKAYLTKYKEGEQ